MLSCHQRLARSTSQPAGHKQQKKVSRDQQLMVAILHTRLYPFRPSLVSRSLALLLFISSTFWTGVPVEMNYKHSHFLMTLIKTITVNRQGTSKRDFHLDLCRRLSEQLKCCREVCVCVYVRNPSKSGRFYSHESVLVSDWELIISSFSSSFCGSSVHPPPWCFDQ